MVSVVDRRPRRNNICTGDPTGTINQRVITKVVAWITSTGGGDIAKPAATDWVRCVVGQLSDEAGHVIGNLLGGKGEGPPAALRRPDCDGVAGANCFNIFPQNRRANRGKLRWRDQQVSMQLRGNRVCIQIELVYSGENYDPLLPGRPGKLIYDVWVNYVQKPGDFNNPAGQWVPTIDNPK